MCQGDGTTASYAYNADGKRISKTVNGTTTGFVWDGGNMIISGNSKYSYGVNGIEAVSNGTVNVYVKDIHGNITRKVDLSGNITSAHKYDSFGRVYEENDSYTDPFGYCGEYLDAETGYVYLRARMYDPDTGRFITEDPIKDGLNWYVYCGNNPIAFVDPWGLKDVPLRETVENLGGTVFWDSSTNSATVSFGSAGSATYKVNEYKVNPSDSSSSLYPHLRWGTDGNTYMYIDDNILYADFGIKDSVSRYSDDLNDIIRFVLFEQQGERFQRMTIGNVEYEHKKVNYNSFNFATVAWSWDRYRIGIGRVTSSDLRSLNNAWKTDVRDAVTVLGSDPSFSLQVNFVFSLIDWFLPYPTEDNVLTSDDIRITFAKNVYFIDNTTKALIAN